MAVTINCRTEGRSLAPRGQTARARLLQALVVGGLAMPSIGWSASGGTTAASPAHPKLWLEAQVDPVSPYVQAQAIYTLRFYQAVSASDLDFHGPDAALAEISPIPGERVEEVSHAGQRYRMTERRYAIFPFASGRLKLAGAHVNAHANVAQAASRLRIEAPSLELDVQPMPPGKGDSAWVPARNLVLTTTWDSALEQVEVGQPLRRTIRLEATGLHAAQLPIVAPEGDGFSAYPEPPRLENRHEDGWTVGTREQTWRLVPTRSGTLTLSALHLPWWDVIARQPRRVDSPALEIEVRQSSPPYGTPPAAAAIMPESDDTSPSTETGTKLRSLKSAQGDAQSIAPLFALIPLLLAVVAGLWYRQRIRSPIHRLRLACRHNDPYAARDALHSWARKVGVRDALSLPAIARHFGKRATVEALADLDRHLYGAKAAPWDGRTLLIALRQDRQGFKKSGTSTIIRQ